MWVKRDSDSESLIAAIAGVVSKADRTHVATSVFQRYHVSDNVITRIRVNVGSGCIEPGSNPRGITTCGFTNSVAGIVLAYGPIVSQQIPVSVICVNVILGNCLCDRIAVSCGGVYCLSLRKAQQVN